MKSNNNALLQVEIISSKALQLNTVALVAQENGLEGVNSHSTESLLGLISELSQDIIYLAESIVNGDDHA